MKMIRSQGSHEKSTYFEYQFERKTMLQPDRAGLDYYSEIAVNTAALKPSNELQTIANYKPSRMMKAGLNLMKRTRAGTLDIILPGGARHSFRGDKKGPKATIFIHNDRVVRRFLFGGKLGFCESYLDGDWSSPDIATFFRFILANADVLDSELKGSVWPRIASLISHRLRSNTKAGSRKNIYSHYDIGNDFYSYWLDSSMTYSAGIFDGPHDFDLEKAQDRKYQAIIDRLNLNRDMHIVEIGCGWGGFAEYAARSTGCRITAITISKAQFDYAKKRIQDAGLEHLVDVKMCDYRDLEGQYDAAVSIEMFEAVGEAYWPSYFTKIRECLKPGAKAVLQIITITNDGFALYRKTPDYIQRYIFPGGMLPSPQKLSEAIDNARLTEQDSFSFGRDYARTLMLWNKAFQKNWSLIQSYKKFDSRFKRLWEQYLCYCEAGFDMGTIDVIHIQIQRPDTKGALKS